MTAERTPVEHLNADLKTFAGVMGGHSPIYGDIVNPDRDQITTLATTKYDDHMEITMMYADGSKSLRTYWFDQQHNKFIAQRWFDFLYGDITPVDYIIRDARGHVIVDGRDTGPKK